MNNENINNYFTIPSIFYSNPSTTSNIDEKENFTVILTISAVAVTCLILMRKIYYEGNFYQQRKFTTEIETELAKKGFFKADFLGKSWIFINPKQPNLLIKCPNPHFPDFDLLNRRLNLAIIGRAFLEKYQFQSLTIPNVRVEGIYLVEERLPIKNDGYQSQMELYYKHRELFTNAIEEFTTFLCFWSYSDLLNKLSSWAYLSEIEVPRYDNTPLFLQNGKGEMGLVDMEHFSLGINYEKRLEDPEIIFHACRTALIFFPFHFDSIFKMGYSHNSEIINRKQDLEEIQKKSLAYFEKIVGNHNRFLVEKGISLVNCSKIVEPDNQTKLEIIAELQNDLLEFNFSKTYSNDEKWISDLKHAFEAIDIRSQTNLLKQKIFPLLIEQTLAFNKTWFKKALEENSQKEKNFPTELLELRTVYLRMYELKPLINKKLSQFEFFKKNSHDHFTEWCIDSIYRLLIEKKIISSRFESFYGGKDLVLF